MKKLLGICILAGVFLLSACGSNSGVLVCTEADGNTIRAYHEDGEITSFVTVTTEDISDMDEADIAFFTGLADAAPEKEYSIDGDILTLTVTIEGEAIQAMIPGASLDLDEFAARMESDGITCE